jgi:general secretion pathway protein G
MIILLAILDFVGGGMALLFALILFVLVAEKPVLIPFVVGFGVVGSLQIAAGIGLLKLQGYGRVIQIGFAIPGLLVFPVGTIVAGAVLWYLFRPHVRLLFSGRTAEQLSAAELEQLERASDVLPIVAVAVGLMLVPFVGVISAIAIPNFLNAVDRAKQKRTMADMRTLASGIQAYAIDQDFYPHATSISELRPLIEPIYVVATPQMDAWGRPMIVLSSHTDYVIQSAGKDGVVEESPPLGATNSFNADIILSNGQFIQWPEGGDVGDN